MLRLFAVIILLAACGESSSTPDATVDSGGFTTCDGACTTTELTATFGSTRRVLDHAVYGVTTSRTGTTLHVEAYRGGDSGCPTMTSAQTDYTLVLGRVPVPTSTTASTSPGNLLDFQGDLLGGALGAAATAVTITPVAADGSMFVALDLALTFNGGTVMGHLYATHCASLDVQE